MAKLFKNYPPGLSKQARAKYHDRRTVETENIERTVVGALVLSIVLLGACNRTDTKPAVPVKAAAVELNAAR